MIELPIQGVIVRPSKDSDINFILSTWLREFEAESFFARYIPHRVYQDQHAQVVSNILSRILTTVTVIAAEEDPDTILAYCVWEATTPRTTLHWVQVKPSHRQFGLGGYLVRSLAEEMDYSHQTHIFHTINRKWMENNSIRKQTCKWCYETLRRVRLDKGADACMYLCNCKKSLTRDTMETPEARPDLTYNPYLSFPKETTHGT